MAVYHGRLAPPGPDYETSGNALLNRLYGATLHDVPWTGDRNAAIRDLAERLRAEGRRPYVVPYGVSSTLGALAYASAAVEIARQCHALGFEPAAIVQCSGSGGIQAGLAIGASACLPRTRVVGIDIDAEPERVRADVERFAKEAAAMLDITFVPEDIEIVAGHAGPGYGVPHAATLEAIGLAGRLEATLVDPVYSGKGLAGLIALMGEGRWSQDDHIVFLHTGGVPALFAYRETLAF